MNHWFSNLNLSGLILAAEEGAKTAAAAAAAATSTTTSTGTPLWIVLLSLVAMIVLPFVIGQWLANTLKVKDMGNRFGIVLFALVIGIAPFAVHMLTEDPKEPGQPRKLVQVFNYGIDLAGGTNLVFQVDRAAVKASGKAIDSITMQKMVAAINKRINPSGTEEVTVRLVGTDRIEVIVPGANAERTQRIKNQITNLGDLEFCLLANSEEHLDKIAQAEQVEINKGTGVREIYNSRGELILKWREPGKVHGTSEYKKVGDGGGKAKSRTFERNGKQITEFLVVCAERQDHRITGDDLVNTRQGQGEGGTPTVDFTFNSRGGALFGQLTGDHLPKAASGFKTQLAILLNDEIHSAPTINDRISGNGQISGQFSQAEIDELITVLNAGALKVPLVKEPANEFTISPLLGEDIRSTGLRATWVSMIAVFLITACYYLKAGLIADLCLSFNLLLLLASMALIDATLTLPGIAGVVLSVSMAVDSNVLIFERMREELAKGSSMRMAIKNGFDKALGTIIDSNATTLISALVLYYVGTDQVKGFAVTLFIGIVISLFTTVYVARVIFELLERTGRLKTLKMFSVVKQTNFDFVGKTKQFVIGSQIVILLGLAIVAFRGRDSLDIDFRGGAMITFRVSGSQNSDIDAVRAQLTKQFGEGISLERLEVTDEKGLPAELFRMRTVIDAEEAAAKAGGQKVEAQLREKMSTAFEGSTFNLVQQTLKLSVGSVIPPTTDKLEDAALAHENEFQGGQQFTATVGQPLTASAFAESVREVLRDIGAAGQRYQDADKLVEARNAEANAAPDKKTTSIAVRLSNLVSAEDATQVLSALKTKLDRQPQFEELTTFSSSVAGDTQMRAVLAIAISLLAITAYLWFRFHGMTFGLAATIAVFHDVAFTLGAVTVGAYLSHTALGRALYLIDFKINLTMIAAFLTIIGYSMNDTIVVFDRIREVRGKSPKITWEMVNTSLNQTLSRTLLTSVTTIITATILYFFGGEGLRGFAFSLTIGIVVGTYSSIYIASPALVWLMNREHPETKPAPKQLATASR